jgi:hypothetical protein
LNHRSLQLATAVLVATAIPAAAATAVVPRDYRTIQEAIYAVAGTSDPRVRIDSNKAFDETLRISDDVTIEAGPRYHPTLRGKQEGCAFPVVGNCVIDLRALPGTVVDLRLVGLRIVPGNSARPGDRIIQAYADSNSGTRLELDNVTIDNRGKAVHGIVMREDGSEDGDGFLRIQDSLLRWTGNASGVVAVDTVGIPAVDFLHSRLVLATPVGVGLKVFDTPDGNIQPRLMIRESSFDVTGKVRDRASAHVLLSNAFLQADDNVFFSRTVGGGQVIGIAHFGDRQFDFGSNRIDRNTFQHKGSGATAAIEFLPEAERTSVAEVTNNVVTDHTFALVVSPKAAPVGKDDAYVHLLVTNNTFERALGDAVFVDAPGIEQGLVSFWNNLVTRSRGYAVRFGPPESLGFGGGRNGFFGNQRGNFNVPLSSIHDVLSDPRYVSKDDLRLRPDSPMIDAGDNEAAATLEYDRFGRPRGSGDSVDIGAFEYQEPVRQRP